MHFLPSAALLVARSQRTVSSSANGLIKPSNQSLVVRRSEGENGTSSGASGAGIDIAHCEAAKSRFDTDRQLIAVLIVNYLVRLRHSDPGRRGSRNRREPPATTTHPEHALPCSCYCAEALPR